MKKFFILMSVLLATTLLSCESDANTAIKSIETGHTIIKVESAKRANKKSIIAVTYNGKIMEYGYNGNKKWESKISDGILCNDIWCDDITGDNIDEILVAVADGTIHCLDSKGNTMWVFQQNPIPFNSVCTVKNTDGTKFIACGGNDMNLYYVSTKGELLKTIASSSYETVLVPSPDFVGKDVKQNVHAINHVRPLPQEDGSDVLLVNGIVCQADKQCMLFQFKPMEEKPFKSTQLVKGYGPGPVGELCVREMNGEQMVLFGTVGVAVPARKALNAYIYNPKTDDINSIVIGTIPNIDIKFGYRMVHPEKIKMGGKDIYLALVGEYLAVIPASFSLEESYTVKDKYSFFDMCTDLESNKVVLASAQSGGSCIHIIDVDNPTWESEFEQLAPKGKIQKILDNSAVLESEIASFSKPAFERSPEDIYFMDSPREPKELIDTLKTNYPHLKFLSGYNSSKGAEDWDRAIVKGTAFANSVDLRVKYTAKQKDIVAGMAKSYGKDGLCTGGGHGTDPFFYNPETLKKAMSAGKGKKSVWIWPELTILHKDEFDVAVAKLFNPLAEHAKENNAMICARSKHLFWLSEIYQPRWSRFLTGEFADVLLPAMEETADKSMDLSLPARLGMWTSGAANNWSTRCARDNPSYARNRQYSNQNLPNHFLRNSVFHTSYGANYVNNVGVTTFYKDYMSSLWIMLAKGVIFVPKREEILSFSPVHLSMFTPDKYYATEGSAGTGAIRTDAETAAKNKLVFDRVNGTWPGAPVTEWDFSRYANGVNDRRVNFLAPYPNGVVLITPPQEGKYADKDAVRGKLVNHLHPIYKDIMEEFYTDGRNYYNADKTKTYSADEYYKVVEKAIKEKSKLLPVVAKGDNIAWVSAQSAPKHIRLTLLDGGYINPNDRVAEVTFNTVEPVKIIDVLTGEELPYKKGSKKLTVGIPCGMFRFLDIEISKEL